MVPAYPGCSGKETIKRCSGGGGGGGSIAIAMDIYCVILDSDSMEERHHVAGVGIGKPELVVKHTETEKKLTE